MSDREALPSPLIVATQVFGRDTDVPPARNAQYRVHSIPWDHSLAYGGRIDAASLGSPTVEAYEKLVAAVRRSCG